MAANPTNYRPVVVVFLAVVALVWLIAWVGNRPPDVPADLVAAVGPRTPSDADYRVAAELAVRQQLRDPESAEFRDVRVRHTNGSTAVCGQVNAKNGFGGYTGYTDFIVLGAIPMTRSSENARAFAKLWTRFCTERG